MPKDKFSEKKYQKMGRKEALKKATLAAFLCWLSVLIILTSLEGTSELRRLNSLREESGIDWMEFEGGIRGIIGIAFIPSLFFLIFNNWILLWDKVFPAR